MPGSEEGTVYMLCFSAPLGDPTRPRMSARHYIGWFANPNRLEHHRNGTSGVKIVYAFFTKKTPFVVARTTPGGKALERRIKRSGNHARNCPNCNPTTYRNGAWAPLVTSKST